MKIKDSTSTMLTTGLLAVLITACASTAGRQAGPQAEAKITRADAERLALAKVPNGTVKEGELEREQGKLIWSFDIATSVSKDVTEVSINALTGEVIAIAKEKP